MLFLLVTAHAKVEEVKESKQAKAAPEVKEAKPQAAPEVKEAKPQVAPEVKEAKPQAAPETKEAKPKVVENVKQTKPIKEKTPEPKAKVVPVFKTVVLENVEIGAVDIDQAKAAKLTGATYPAKLSKAIVADRHHKLILKFTVKDQESGEKLKVHQAFVKLAMKNSEIIYVAERDNVGTYRFDLDVNAKAEEFGGNGGTYAMSVIIGDAKISNSINWHLADVKFEFPGMYIYQCFITDDRITTLINFIKRKYIFTADASTKDSTDAWDKPKPEIKHMFREPEKRPPALVSTAFTVLCILPFVALFLVWGKLGANISLFPFGLSSIFFTIFLGAIFVLYVCFWLQLNMFTSMKYLIMIGVVAFLSGNSLLVKIAEKRKSSS